MPSQSSENEELVNVEEFVEQSHENRTEKQAADSRESQKLLKKSVVVVAAAAIALSEVIKYSDQEFRFLRRQHRENRQQDLLVKSVIRILRQPEFSHSVRVHSSQAHVINFIRSNQEEFFSEAWESYNDHLKDIFKGLVAATTIGAIFFLAVTTFCAQWAKNDGLNNGGFPSTLWWNDVVRQALGDSGTWAACIIVGIALLSLIIGRVTDLRYQIVDTLRARDAIQDTLTPHVRVAVNEWSDKESPTELRFEEAPGLGSTTDMMYLVERNEARRIGALIRELGASAVAISGPRGAGKTTLLRKLAEYHNSPHDLFVALDAPASYQPKEFVVTLYQQLCKSIIVKGSRLADSVIKRTFDRLVIALRLVFLLLAVATASSQWKPAREWLLSYLPASLPPQTAWQAGVYVLLALIVRGLLNFLRPQRGQSGAAELVRRATAESNRLRFLQNVAIERSGTLKASIGFDLGRKHTKQLLEQAASMPELVQSYRSLASDAILWWRRSGGEVRGNLVIVIDELDRVTDVDAAERFINDVKGIFGITYCTYLVTVSEDALAQFERRMVGIRPALDSTFDETVRLPILRLTQSREILARRLVGFPQAFIALCHALSGGIPRDLIRSARALIDARQTTKQDHLVPLAHEIVRQEIARLKSGLIGKINASEMESDSFKLLRLLADPEWPEGGSGGLLRAAAQLLPPPESPDSQSRTRLQLGVALYYYATTVEIFETFEYRLSGEADYAAERLALTRSVMPTSTELAYVHIQNLRTIVGFNAIQFESD